MKTFNDPKGIYKFEDDDKFRFAPNYEELTTEVERGDFKLTADYSDEPIKTLVCKHCGSDSFIVGVGNYFTGIKCQICEYEICVHEG